jgi:hypothetical protein
MNSSMLEFALHYQARGFSVIAIKGGTKNRPRGKWKPFQTKPADELQLRKWFARGSNNIAVVHGSVSGGLGCRDYDRQEDYHRWAAEHPNLAAILPTVVTARGSRVYFRTMPENLFFVDLRDVQPPEDGEYSASCRHYSVLPPSRHPDGPIYRWVVPLPDGEIPFVADVRAAGLLPSHVADDQVTHEDVTEETDETEEAQETEDTEETEETEETEAIRGRREKPAPSPPNCLVSSVSSVTSGGGDAEIDAAILKTIPSGIGRRNRQVFELARALRGIPRLADAPVDTMQAHVRRWHRIGLAKGVIGTEPFEETWIDFIHAWPRVRFPKGNQRLLNIVQRAKESISTVPQRYEGAGLRLLVAICREFQRDSGGQPFFLSCRMASALLDLGENGHVTAWRWLELLVHDHVLEVVEPAQRGRRRAARYRYTGDSQA